MTNIRDIRLVDLLPPNIAKDPKVGAAAKALDGELQAVTAAVAQCMLLARIDELSEPVIDQLAWQFHVDYFYEDFPPLTQKREILKQTLRWHKHKGTVAAVEEVISSVFNKGEVVEWFKYNGQPYCFIIKVRENAPDAQKLTRLLYLINKAKNARSWLECIVGIPDRMLLLNQAGALVTVTQDLSWQETKTWKVFTGPRLNAAGPVEVTKIDQSWTETITHRLFTGPRLNAAGQVQVIDTSWQETITQKVFTGPRLSGSLKLNGTGRLNQAPSADQIVPILHLTQERRFLAPVFALNSRGYLNQAPYATTLETVLHPDIRLVRSLPSAPFKLNSGQRLNAGQFQEIKETVTHTKVIQQKKFNPELGMVLNGKPVLGYMWKKELKEVA